MTNAAPDTAPPPPRDALPGAERIEVGLAARSAFPFYGFTTAVDPAAPPLLSWDKPESRNPLSWYTYVRGSSAESWGLRADEAHAVTAIVRFPGPLHGFLLAIAGCRDSASPHNGLWPGELRPELHGVRAVIEAHNTASPPARLPDGELSGIAIRTTGALSDAVIVYVTRNGLRSAYIIDRWE